MPTLQIANLMKYHGILKMHKSVNHVHGKIATTCIYVHVPTINKTRASLLLILNIIRWGYFWDLLKQCFNTRLHCRRGHVTVDVQLFNIFKLKCIRINTVQFFQDTQENLRLIEDRGFTKRIAKTLQFDVTQTLEMTFSQNVCKFCF